MRVLHLHTHLNIACGITRTIYLLVKGLNDGVEHRVICFGGDAIEQFEQIGCPPVVLNADYHSRFAFLKARKYVKDYAQRWDIRLLHAHHRYFDLLGATLRKRLNTPVLTSVQSEVRGKRLFSYKADHFAACSNFIKTHLEEYFRVPPDKISVIHNFLDPVEVKVTVQPEPLRRTLKIPEGKRVIGYIGRISRCEKGIEYLLDAFRRLSEKRDDIFLLLVGAGEDERFTRDYIDTHRLPAFLSGPKPDIYNYFNLAEVIAMPSLVEPFGIVAIEAGAMKKPLVAAATGGLPEIVKDNVNGLLVPPGDAAALEEAMDKLLGDRKKSSEMAASLSETAIAHFGTGQIAKYRNLYMELTGNG